MWNLPKIELGAGRPLYVETSAYAEGGATAITLLTENGSPFLKLTVNVPDIPLEDGEILVKTWSENEPYIPLILETGYFKDTGKRVKLQFVEASVWTIPGEKK